MATNHFGPFLLTGLLLPQLVASEAATVVTVVLELPPDGPVGAARATRPCRRAATASGAPTRSPSCPTCCSPTSSTGGRREAGLPVKALAAHPGFAGTHLAANGQYGRSSGGIASILDAAVKAISQSAAAGAWPTLMAATADLPGGDVRRPGRPRRDRRRAPGGDVHVGLARRRERAAPALGAQRADDRHQLPLTPAPCAVPGMSASTSAMRSSTRRAASYSSPNSAESRSSIARRWRRPVAREHLPLLAVGDQLGPAVVRVRHHLEDPEVHQLADQLAHRLPGHPGRGREVRRPPSRVAAGARTPRCATA